MTAARYRKRPVVVEAIQFTGGNVAEIMKWSGAEEEWDDDAPCAEIVVETLHGAVTAIVGDWIVVGPGGDMWPVAKKLFFDLYEPVDN